MPATETSALMTALHADAPATDRQGLYAFLIGSWDMDALFHPDSGPAQAMRGEIHAGWVLAGRALQDVWILPGLFHGTTLRVYDPGLDAWHIHWLDPVMQLYPRQIGRAEGPDIVQEGVLEDGRRLRWRFTGIRPGSFHWLGEIAAGAEAWRLQLDVRARRREG